MTIVTEALPSLAGQILSGIASRELKLLAARGLLPIAPEDLLPLQIQLAEELDPEIAGRAQIAIKATEARLVIDFVAHAAREPALAYLSRSTDDPAILDALIRRRDVPRPLLAEIAPRLSVPLQEVLILRQDAIVEHPRILDALETNPYLETHVRRRIHEYREHLLPRSKKILDSLPTVTAGEAGDGELVSAILAVEAVVPPAGEVEEKTGLTESQLRALPLPARLRLSRGAPRTLRGFLLKDPHPLVAVSALTNNVLSDEELEMVARSRLVVEDVLVEMARHRDWMNKYSVVNALVANPRTPVGVALRHLSKLGIRDLRALSHSHNVSAAIKSAARRYYHSKTA
ncbi:MAG TPA: hypothetical protein VF017_13475 [Thermoanaerobaculia bacterium]|nr:hypothetical protein [Thermoanaerobaculia bacterium]